MYLNENMIAVIMTTEEFYIFKDLATKNNESFECKYIGDKVEVCADEEFLALLGFN